MNGGIEKIGQQRRVKEPTPVEEANSIIKDLQYNTTTPISDITYSLPFTNLQDLHRFAATLANGLSKSTTGGPYTAVIRIKKIPTQSSNKAQSAKTREKYYINVKFVKRGEKDPAVIIYGPTGQLMAKYNTSSTFTAKNELFVGSFSSKKALKDWLKADSKNRSDHYYGIEETLKGGKKVYILRVYLRATFQQEKIPPITLKTLDGKVYTYKTINEFLGGPF